VDALLEGPVSITYALMAACIGVSLIGFLLLRHERYGPCFLFIPSETAKGRNWLGTLLSHFAHADLGHLAVNMLALYFFGQRVEAALGGWMFLTVYAASGVAGTIVVFLLRRKNPRHSALGASGCIAGVVFATVVIAPTTTMVFLFLPFPIPAPIFALLYLVASSLMMQRGDHVAHEAHIGGAVAGFALAGLLFEPGFAPLLDAVRQLAS
jgi:membrane associated rhomboid family serine protease